MTSTSWFFALAAAVALAACSKQETVLTGEREGIREVLQSEAARVQDASPAQNKVLPVALPAPQVNPEWRQSIGSPDTRVAHPALGAAPSLAWSVGIGNGDGRRVRITADPVVAGGRIFTLDSMARVTAVSPGGQVLWTADVTPPNDRSDNASGGGLAYGDDTLFVASGFGRLTALDPESGTVRWHQDLGAPVTAAPAVKDGLVYVVSGDQVGWALKTRTGRIAWQLSGTPDIHNVLGGPAPAITEKYVVFSYGAGEVQGAFREGGLRIWDAQVAGQRPGAAASRVNDITAGPVVVGDRLFAGTHSGRTVALSLGSGNRLWTVDEGPLNRVWPAGGSVFFVSDRNQLVRRDAEDGSRIWVQNLSLFEDRKPKRQAKIVGHFGPVIAGGQLILASADERLRFFDPASGQMTRAIDLPGGATSNPVVAGGTLYVVTKKGQLLAFR